MSQNEFQSPDAVESRQRGQKLPVPEADDERLKEVVRELSKERPSLSVVIPAYNEEESVGGTVRSIDDAIDRVCNSYEIIVVDDGSEDETKRELSDVSEDLPSTRFISNDQNRGKGYAIRDGCRVATGEYVLLMDADGELTPERIESYLERAQEEDADVVIGSKRHPESEVVYPAKRRLLSWMYSLLIRFMFGLEVTDTQVGMKLLRGSAVEDVMPLLLVERYAYDVELLALAHRHGYTIAEAPVSIDFNGGSSLDWSEVWLILTDTLAVFLRLQLLESYEKIDRAVRYDRESNQTLRSGEEETNR